MMAVAVTSTAQGLIRLTGVVAVAGLLALGAYKRRRLGLSLAGKVDRTWLRRHPSALVFAAVVSAVVLAAVLVRWAPQWLASTEGLKPNEAAEERGRVRTALLAVVAGALAALGAYYTHRTFALNRAGQITERFTRAIDQLGNRELDVRLGGIYALERIARDSSDDHPQVVEVLTAYVREHARWTQNTAQPAVAKDREAMTSDKAVEAIRAIERIARNIDVAILNAPSRRPERDDKLNAGPLPTDLQAVMSVLGRRDHSRDRPGAHIDLIGTDLRRVVLQGEQAHLEGALLSDAHLESAQLKRAHLERAQLVGAYLGGAQLERARLQRARLAGAHLEGAQLTGAHFEGAQLDGAHLESAQLTGAHLEGAQLTEANLAGAELVGAHLEGTNFLRARLDGARLEGAVFDDNTTWPAPDFDALARGARHLRGDGSVPVVAYVVTHRQAGK
jgi:uncharacterized protein YjbI with pentapeptide repeats